MLQQYQYQNCTVPCTENLAQHFIAGCCHLANLIFTDTDLCPCGETQTMFHIVESCPLAKLNGGLSRLHSADENCFVADQLWFMTRIQEEDTCT